MIFASLLTVPIEAGSSGDQRIVRKLKKQNSALKRKVKSLTAQLATARRSIPSPAPFIEMVSVGNVGNAADVVDGDNHNDGVQTFGAVNYQYRIGKYEVNLEQYASFLNAVARTDTYELYHQNMAADMHIAGISRAGAPGNYSYTVLGSGKRPITYVSWFDAARFCNWLHNGRPTGDQDASTTERGTYTLDGATAGNLDIERNPGSTFWLPSEDEWYKAAYHRPQGQGGPASDYYLYPTASDTPPGNMVGPSPLVNQANHDNGVYSVTQESIRYLDQNYLTDGGAFEESSSYYGTFDQGGNVWEWEETPDNGTKRSLRSGSWFGTPAFMGSTNRGIREPEFSNNTIGFRVAGPCGDADPFLED